MNKEELVSSLEDKVFISTIDGFHVFGFIRFWRGRFGVGPLVFGLTIRAMIVIVSLSLVILPSLRLRHFNLAHALFFSTLYCQAISKMQSHGQLKVVQRNFNSVLTLSKSAQEDSMLSTGIFSESERSGELG
jgi:hypothetical protein